MRDFQAKCAMDRLTSLERVSRRASRAWICFFSCILTRRIFAFVSALLMQWQQVQLSGVGGEVALSPSETPLPVVRSMMTCASLTIVPEMWSLKVGGMSGFSFFFWKRVARPTTWAHEFLNKNMDLQMKLDWIPRFHYVFGYI